MSLAFHRMEYFPLMRAGNNGLQIVILHQCKFSTEPPGTYRLESYSIRSAFDLLDKSGEIAVDEMAGLEFRYIGAFDHDDSKIPNLEQHIEKHPELYIHAVALAYKRDDDGEDPKELQSSDPTHIENRAVAAYKFLGKLARIPGRNRAGELEAERIEEWVRKVREGCKEFARAKNCDHSLGKLFSTAPIDDDGVWPCKPVRDALEKIATDSLSDGLKTSLYNARGVHYRGEGGDQERGLSEQYRTWALALDYTHPRVSKILMGLVETYEREATWEDIQAIARKRLRC